MILLLTFRCWTSLRCAGFSVSPGCIGVSSYISTLSSLLQRQGFCAAQMREVQYFSVLVERLRNLKALLLRLHFLFELETALIGLHPVEKAVTCIQRVTQSILWHAYNAPVLLPFHCKCAQNTATQNNYVLWTVYCRLRSSCLEPRPHKLTPRTLSHHTVRAS